MGLRGLSHRIRFAAGFAGNVPRAARRCKSGGGPSRAGIVARSSEPAGMSKLTGLPSAGAYRGCIARDTMLPVVEIARCWGCMRVARSQQTGHLPYQAKRPRKYSVSLPPLSILHACNCVAALPTWNRTRERPKREMIRIRGEKQKYRARSRVLSTSRLKRKTPLGVPANRAFTTLVNAMNVTNHG
ncbi:hypothetical protein KM043_015005 [Ampulex compressa]|nr:hypothetical protein KM043_015005 [Ampulex compressa]